MLVPFRAATSRVQNEHIPSICIPWLSRTWLATWWRTRWGGRLRNNAAEEHNAEELWIHFYRHYRRSLYESAI